MESLVVQAKPPLIGESPNDIPIGFPRHPLHAHYIFPITWLGPGGPKSTNVTWRGRSIIKKNINAANKNKGKKEGREGGREGGREEGRKGFRRGDIWSKKSWVQ